ncbi:penicillin-binding protein 1C [Chitinilyticum litopenaei]|uniref:penicillin-binding protein 1C n=1 Tax=Chitinilyticum litopenaei TaxID=1121276 RepID=UPI001B7FEA05|nr:penicillin-binding protein 1C [Chitinilyticum litopenaei]
MTMRATVTAVARWYWRKRWRRVLLLLALLLLVLRLWPHPPLSHWLPGSTAVMSRDGQLLRLTLASDERYRLWIPLEQMSPQLVDAVQLYEDRWFYWHPGVNPYALARAAVATYTGGSRQGGSTLTMQLARLLYRLDTRDPAGKLQQIGLALWLEARYGKRELLEAYLNVAPYGRNIEGVAAASLIYFGKPAHQLTLPEAMTLAVIPQAPNQRQASGVSLQRARQRLFAQWIVAGYAISESERQILQLPVPARRLHQLPFLAPHLVEQQLGGRAAAPPARLVTTVDARLQRLLERQVARYLEQVGARGVHNASAMIVDTRDMGVRALLGSADYFDSGIAGQVNGTLGRRSPGSTLKPLLYGLAIDQGLIHPRSVLKDAPSAFGPFQPENFDGRFAGPVNATDALTRSRNVPAVWLASQLRHPNLYDTLKMAGVSGLQSEAHYGLALALGGGELTMQELAGLYAMLANQGLARPLRFAEDEPPRDGPRLLSPEASFLVLDMLEQNPRPDALAQARRQGWPVAWKTGTSWGFRDAWTAGVVGPYVVVVWLGNFDGRGNPALVGLDMAAPLFFRIADALQLASGEARPARLPPPGVIRTRICADSGDLPNQWCPRVVDGWFIPGKSPIRVSELHRPVMIDTRSGAAACPPFDARYVRAEVFEFWPSDLARLFREAGMPRRVPPQASCGEGAESSAAPPLIRSPLRDVVYVLGDGEDSIALQATAAAGVRTLYWFADRSLIGSTAAGGAGLAWRPQQAGRIVLSVVDDAGRSSSRVVLIELR